MSNKPQILVYCANGLQGRAIVSQLSRAGFPVRAMIRDLARSAHLTQFGAEVVEADLDAPDTLRRALRHIDVALMQLPAGDDADSVRRRGRAAIETMAETGIRGVIFNAAVRYPRAAAELPSFEARQAVEEHLRSSGLEWAIVRQTFLLQNLLLPWVVRGVANDGAIVYPVGAEVELSWVAAEDVGRLAPAILEHDLFGETFDLGAERLVTGDELARSFAAALGRPVRFVSLPLTEFERGVDAAIGPGAGRRIGAIFQFIETHPQDRAFVATPYAAPARLSGFAPMAIGDWVRLHRDAFLQ